MKILMISNPSCPLTYGPEGSPQGGGRNAFLQITSLLQSQHQVKAAVPMGSDIPGIDYVFIPGDLFNINTHHAWDDETLFDFYPITYNSCLVHMWEYVNKSASQYDLIINFAQDWLPYFLMDFIDTPIFHRMNHVPISSVTRSISQQRSEAYPLHFAAVSKTQIKESGMSEKFVFPLLQGINIDDYSFHPKGDDGLAVIARIEPSKGIIDAVEAAFRTNNKLYVYGSITDKKYANEILEKYPNTVIFKGYVNSDELKKNLGRHKCLLMTHKWVEAMALGGVEALAVGLPIITYNRGGPPEIVSENLNGFIVEPDDIDSLVGSIKDIKDINRETCRKNAEDFYGLNAFESRLLSWLKIS